MSVEFAVLLLEDDDRRAERIAELVHDAAGTEELSFTRARHVAEAGRTLQGRPIDLLILDVCVPMREGEDPAVDGGVRLLRELKSNRILKVPGAIVGITGYGELEARYSAEFGESLWTLLRFEASSDAWAARLRAHVEHLVQARRGSGTRYATDLCILTALYPIELEAVLALDAGWVQFRRPGDDAIYHRGVFRGATGTLDVVAAAALEMGMPASAAVAVKMIEAFRPRYIAMAGIAAGVKGDFGDILVASQSWDYGSGKISGGRRRPTVFSPAPSAIQLDQGLLYQLNWFSVRRGILDQIRLGWKGSAPRTKPAVHIGPVASGASVVAARRVISALQRHNRKLVGVEMETYAVFVAARICSEPRPLAMSVKSVCDFGSAKKDDRYQQYAAYTSARFLFDFACEALPARAFTRQQATSGGKQGDD